MTFALIDGNSFYCSCERLFEPRLAARPVIVLSNNDGCAVARTNEAKALGIKMGDPYFKIKDLCARERVAVFSSNYALYGDISRRMNEVYRTVSPAVEVYSIDETFIDMTGFAVERVEGMARDLRARIQQWIGIPTCVGLGPTKALAKLANKLAKSHPDMGGVCDLRDESERGRLLATFPVGDVWGIGGASQRKLAAIGVTTAAELRDMDLKLARRLMSVVGERIVVELRGVSCLPLETVAPTRKGLAVTRSFGTRITNKADMTEAVATYAARAAEKLRTHGLVTGMMNVFMHTSPFADGPRYSAARTLEYVPPTNDTRSLVRGAGRAVEAMWKDGFAFAKAGVMCDDLVKPDDVPVDLLSGLRAETDGRLMVALDAINRRFGRDMAVIASSGIKRGWSQKFEKRSPRYTTRIDELPLC